MRHRSASVICAAICLAVGRAAPAAGAHAEAPTISFWHLPEGAIQPQAAVDARGVVHLVYFRASGKVGDLFYVRRAPGESAASAPIRVNSEPGTAGATGTVRTAQIAVGRSGRVHVVWNGLGPAGANGFPVAYQAYTRLDDAGTAFEPQRDLSTWARGLDGGGSVAAGPGGSVYVTWHAMANAADEAGRAVFVAISRDDGRTFAREKQANPEATGACACCGMRAFLDSRGTLYVLYRAAAKGIDRDSMLLVSRDRGATFTERLVDRWRASACPMSTYSLTEGSGAILASWETRDRVYRAAIRPADLTMSQPQSPPGESQKHPFIAAGAGGRTLLVWTEGTGWQRGGTLAWQLQGPGGEVLQSGRKADVVPVWGLATAYPDPRGGFVVVY